MKQRMSKLLPDVFEIALNDSAELERSQRMLTQLQAANGDGRLTLQIRFLQESIDELTQELDLHIDEARAYFDPIKQEDNRAWLLLTMHYIDGFAWPEIAETLHDTVDAAKAHSYRWLKRLQAESRLSPENSGE